MNKRKNTRIIPPMAAEIYISMEVSIEYQEYVSEILKYTVFGHLLIKYK